MTWYPHYVQFIIACKRGNELKLQKIAELLHSAFCVYGANIDDEFEDTVMPEIIKRELKDIPGATSIVFPWGSPEGGKPSIREIFKSTLDDPTMSWIHMVTYNEDPNLEEDTMYSNFELTREGTANQKDFDAFLEKHKGKIGFHFVGSVDGDIVEDYYTKVSSDDDFDSDILQVGAPFVEVSKIRQWDEFTVYLKVRDFAIKLIKSRNLEGLKLCFEHWSENQEELREFLIKKAVKVYNRPNKIIEFLAEKDIDFNDLISRFSIKMNAEKNIKKLPLLIWLVNKADKFWHVFSLDSGLLPEIVEALKEANLFDKVINNGGREIYERYMEKKLIA